MTGAWRLCRFILRRDWMRIVIWLVILGAFAVSIPLVFENMFGSDAERMAMAETMKNPAMIALCGISYGYDDFTTGVQMATEMLLMTMLAVAVANIVMVVRHTRKSEDQNRVELLVALPISRMANLTGILLAALLFNIAIVLVHIVCFGVLGIDSMPFIGNLYYGLCLGITGMFFAVATALIAQIASNSRTATGIAMAVFGISYMVRAVGDLGTEWMSLITPFGLPLRSEPYVDEQFWPLAIMLAATVVVAIPTFLLQRRRDMDAGLMPQRAGRSHAPRSLLSPFGLAWRLNRGMFIAWAIALFVLGAMYGSVFNDLDKFIDSNDFLKTIMGISPYSLSEEFVSMLMQFIPVLAAVPAIFLVLKLRNEERDNKIDHLASRHVSRVQLMTSYVVLSLAGCIVMLFVSVLGLWAAEAAVMADPIPFSEICASGMSYLPAMLVVCGLAVTLVGFVPRLVSLVWVMLGYCFFAGYIARIMSLDDWVSGLSPFHYVKQMPVQDFDVVPIIVLSVVAVALTAIGYIGYRRRDLEG